MAATLASIRAKPINEKRQFISLQRKRHDLKKNVLCPRSLPPGPCPPLCPRSLPPFLDGGTVYNVKRDRFNKRTTSMRSAPNGHASMRFAPNGAATIQPRAERCDRQVSTRRPGFATNDPENALKGQNPTRTIGTPRFGFALSGQNRKLRLRPRAALRSALG